MAVIHVLDKHTAELIAAGEVVERPASVVKELLENAIDAGAAQITVSIESGGVKLIEISDNGTGIEAAYIPTAFIRHATSKIQTEEDLNHIHTLGFRGEALASIASVARVEVLTRTEADECASVYRIEGGEAYPIEPGARSVGTTIRVKDLFYNTPARMKFLKKDSSEGTFVADTVAHVALSHPEVSFKFIREGKLQYVTPGDGQLRSAAYAVLGREFSRDLIELDNREGVYRVWGLITQPRSCRASRSMQYFYINGRYVRNRTMMAGMEMAFKGTTMQGKFPGGILLLEMPSDLVDVNVHPAKTEVRFARENDIFDLVYHATKLALAQPGTGERLFAFEEPKNEKNNEKSNISEKDENPSENTVKKNNFTGLSAVIPGQAEPGTLEQHPKTAPSMAPAAPAVPAPAVPARPVRPAAAEADILPGPSTASPNEHSWTTVAASAPLNPDVSLHSPKRPEEETDLAEPVVPRFRAASSEAQLDIEPDADDLPGAQDRMAAWDPIPQPKTAEPEPAAAEPAEIEETSASAGTPEQMGFDLQEGLEPLRYVGELFRTYILAERGDEVCIIDKHAAHERQLFEKLAASYGDVPSQLLLEPVVVELSAEEKTALLANIDLLERAGLEIDDFGGNSVFLRAVPADVEQGSAEDLLVELAAKLAHGSRDALSEKTEWVLHSISCRAAIKAGDHTSPQELMALAEKILSGEVPPFCPHGRPCVLKLTRKELEKQFGRIV
jgi:DNA mismatch repair protein MutL